jgi:hypothetical protein
MEPEQPVEEAMAEATQVATPNEEEPEEKESEPPVAETGAEVGNASFCRRGA